MQDELERLKSEYRDSQKSDEPSADFGQEISTTTDYWRSFLTKICLERAT
jgi:hypothetical protein